MKGKLRVVVGGQYGSEAKGSVCAELARICKQPLMAVRVAGPNAGHTAYDRDGRRWSFRHIPVAAVINPDAQLLIAAGSEIDEQVLLDEIERCEQGGHPVRHRLSIDGQATKITQQHKNTETEMGLTGRLGSTAKGIGAARADRIMRTAELWAKRAEGNGTDGALLIHKWLAASNEVHIEGTQGYGLGLHTGEYPYSTSSDCRAIDFLAMAGISPWTTSADLEVWVTLRTYPIRVAGNSGPMHDEHTWDQMSQLVGVDLVPERTTVTQKIRRIGGFDLEQARGALRANGHPSPRVRVALTFLDYIDPGCVGVSVFDELSNHARNYVYKLEQRLGTVIDIIGTGPTSMVDRRSTQNHSTHQQGPTT